ncbi:uncharacterized protein TNCV_1888611 [Trichonephila clavipes]|nr:uncharacterized protein TNCV_1888611 [Trichonephila clavipes]
MTAFVLICIVLIWLIPSFVFCVLLDNSPRAAAVAEFRLLTGHDCLCAHLYRFNLADSIFCVLCASGQVMDASHLDVCSALKSLDQWRTQGRCPRVRTLTPKPLFFSIDYNSKHIVRKI